MQQLLSEFDLMKQDIGYLKARGTSAQYKPPPIQTEYKASEVTDKEVK